jgi:RNA polymerase sigma factor (sigma-70 family)
MDALPTLITAAQQGDFAAFGQIVERFRRMAYTTAYNMLHDPQLAEDAMQEAFIEAYLNLSHLRNPETFPGWFSCIIFKQGDRITRRKQVSTIPLYPESVYDLPYEDLNPAQLIEHKETCTQVTEAVNHLNEQERMAIQLFYGNGYGQKAIADYLEIPVSTVKKRLFDGRKHLKEQLSHLVQDALQTRQAYVRPDHLQEKVQLLISIRTGNLAQLTALINHNPFLVNGNLGSKAIALNTLSNIPREWSALHEAIQSHRTDIIALLLERGANPNARNSNGETPLHSAVLTQQPAAVSLLLKYNAQINTITNAGLTALHHAVIRNDLIIARILLQHGAGLNVVGSNPKTPLHWAALKGYTALVKLLLSYEADNTLRDDLGRTALDWAQARHHTAVVAELASPRRCATTPFATQSDATTQLPT